MAKSLLVKQPYPGLDTDGWIITPTAVADRLLGDFFLSDYSQTENFTGRVSSFAWVVKTYEHDSNLLSEMTQDQLSQYFDKYFWEPEVVVNWENEEGSINKQILKIYATFQDRHGDVHNLARLARGDGTRIREIIAISNDGA